MISHLHRCVFVHVPKTAGKSMLAVFGLPMLARDYLDPLVHIEDPYGHRRLVEARRWLEAGYWSFGFVRNPWDRLVSAFFYLDAGGCNAFDAAFREAHLARYGGDFGRFVRDLDRHLEAQHFRPQSHWLADDDGRLLAGFVGRYETLARDFGKVAARLGLDAALPRLNGCAHPRWRDCYDLAGRRIVERLYERDLELFGHGY
jgi:hypothetical protein